LSVCRMFSLQLKPKLGRTKPLTGPHAARGLDIADLAQALVFFNATFFVIFWTLLLSFAAMILTSNFGRLAETGKFWSCFVNAVRTLDQSWFAICLIWTSVTNDNTCIKYLESDNTCILGKWQYLYTWKMTILDNTCIQYLDRLPILCPNNQQSKQLQTDLAEVSGPIRTIWICSDMNQNVFVC